jgi:hypothetical protein
MDLFVDLKVPAGGGFQWKALEHRSGEKCSRYTALQRSLAVHGNPWIERFGAGEGIRTLDPNLGKVVLYP